MADKFSLLDDYNGSADSFSALDTYTPKPSLGPAQSSNLADVSRSLASGLPGIGGAVGYGLEKSGLAPTLGRGLRESAVRATDKINAKQSPQWQEAAAQPLINDDNTLNKNFGLRSLAANVLPSVAGTVAMGVAGGPLASAATKGLSVLGAGANVASKVGSGLGFGASEGVFSGAQNADQWGIEQRAKAPKDANGNIAPELEAAIQKGESDIFAKTAVTTGGLSALTGGGMMGVLKRSQNPIADVAQDGFLKATGKSIGLEALQEAPQSALEQFTTNQATKDYIDPDQDVNAGVLNAGVVGGLSGGVMGAVGGVGNIGPLSRAANKAPLTNQQQEANDGQLPKSGGITNGSNGAVFDGQEQTLDQSIIADTGQAEAGTQKDTVAAANIQSKQKPASGQPDSGDNPQGGVDGRGGSGFSENGANVTGEAQYGADSGQFDMDQKLAGSGADNATNNQQPTAASQELNQPSPEADQPQPRTNNGREETNANENANAETGQERLLNPNAPEQSGAVLPQQNEARNTDNGLPEQTIPIADSRSATERAGTTDLQDRGIVDAAQKDRAFNTAQPAAPGADTNTTGTSAPNAQAKAKPVEAFTPTHKLNDGYDTPVVQTEDGYQDAEGFSYAQDEDATPIKGEINEGQNNQTTEDIKPDSVKAPMAMESQQKPAKQDEAGNLLLQQANERSDGVLTAPKALQSTQRGASGNNDSLTADPILTKSKGAYLIGKSLEFSRANPKAIPAAKKQHADKVKASYDDDLNSALAAAPFDVYAKHPSNKGVSDSILRQSYEALRGGDSSQVTDKIVGDKIDNKWTSFHEKSGSIGIPRAEMPQVKAEHRGALVNFLNAKDISHEQVDIPAKDLKPTQAEFSPEKVEKAKKYEGGDRSILISSDNHVVDGHHQWLAKLDNGEDIKAIRLNAPIKSLINQVKEFPSAETAPGSTKPNEQANQATTSLVDKPADKSRDAAPSGTGATRSAVSEAGEEEYKGVRIYPLTLKNGDYFAVESEDNKQRRLSGDRNRGGDGLFKTVDEAKAEIDKEEVRRKEREKAEKEADEREQAEAAEKAKRDDVDGFMDDAKPAMKALAVKALNKQVRYNGEVTTIKQIVRDKVAKGEATSAEEEDRIKPMTRAQFNRADGKEQAAHERRIKEAGEKTVYYVGNTDLGKFAYDYANYLAAKKATPPKPSPESQLDTTKVKLADDSSIRFSKSLPDNSLAIVHNLSLDNLLHAERMGGIAVPSVAVVDKNHIMDSFGEITLIADKNRLGPEANSKNRFFNADIYSPRYPSVTHVVNYKDFDKLVASLSPEAKEINDQGQRLSMDSIESYGLVKELKERLSIKYEYLLEQGKAPKLPRVPKTVVPAPLKKYVGNPDYFLARDEDFKKLAVSVYNDKVKDIPELIITDLDSREARSVAGSSAELVKKASNEKNGKGAINIRALEEAANKRIKEADFKKWIAKKYGYVVSGEKIFDGYTNSGNRKYLDHNLDNVVKILNRSLKGGENFSYGVPSIRAQAAKQFKTIKSLQDARGHIVNAQDMEALKDEVNKEFDELENELQPYQKYTSAISNQAAEALAGLASKGYREFREYYTDVPQETMQKAVEFLNKLKHMPSHYFEGKIGRSVGINEFSGAIVPTGKEYDDAIALLKSHGVTDIKRYKRNDAETRSKALQSFDKLLFSKSTPVTGSTVADIRAMLPARVNKLVAAGKLEVVQSVDELPEHLNALYHKAWHGSPHDHNKFDSSKIGTGEGGQAYGFGHYFAGAKEIAEWYRDTLGKVREASYKISDGRVVDGSDPLSMYAQAAIDGNLDSLISSLERAGVDNTDSELKFAKSLVGKDVFVTEGNARGGKLYQVELAPSEDEYLDWDKPLSEQSAKVIAALEKKFSLPSFNEDFRSAGEFYRHRTRKFDSQEKASIELNELGIRGIKYLDGSSRGTGEGDYNYVIFDDNDISITAKYSQLDGVEALYDGKNDKLYLVADMLNKDNLPSVLAHELLHRGEAQDPKLKAAIDRFESDLSRRFDLASRNIGTKAELAAYKRVITAETPTKDQAEEFRAYLVSDWVRSPDSFTGKVKQVFADFIASIRAFLIRNALDFGYIKSLTPADLAALSKYGAAVHRQGVDNKILSQLASVYRWEGTAQEYDQQFYDGVFSEDGKKPGVRFENKTTDKANNANPVNKSKPAESALYSKNGSKLPDTITIDGKMRSTLNSNGKPIANTEEGVRNFYRWFGDSKVVDDSGRPLVVYHATQSDFAEFEKNKIGSAVDSGQLGSGFYFTSSTENATNYALSLSSNTGIDGGENIRSVYLRVTKPSIVRSLNSTKELNRKQAEKITNTLMAKGHDGIEFETNFDATWFVAFNPNQIKSAIGNTGSFSAESSDIRYSKSMDSAIVAEAKRKAGLGPKKTLSQTITDILQRGISANLKALQQRWEELKPQLEQGIFDKFYGIKLAEKEILGDVAHSLSGYISARLSTGSSSTMQALLLHGAPKWADGIIQKKDGSKGFAEMLQPVKDDLENFTAWMVGRRADRLYREGKENNFSRDEIDALLALKQDSYQGVADDIAAMNSAVLDLAQDAGLVDPESRKLFENADYIPFYRLVEGKQSGPGKKGGLTHQNSGIKMLKGSDNPMSDPLGNMMQNWAHLIDASMKNDALNKTLNNLDGSRFITGIPRVEFKQALIPKEQVKKLMLESGLPKEIVDAMPADLTTGIAKMWQMQAPADPDVVRVMRDGKSEYYKVNDAMLLTSLTAVNQMPFGGIFKPMRYMKQLLTGAVTADPTFMARNFIRDSMHSWTIAEEKGFKLGLDSIHGAVKSFKEEGGYVDMMFAGASFQGGYGNYNNPDAARESMDAALRRRGIKDIKGFKDSILDTPKKYWEMYRAVGDAIENASREAILENSKQAGAEKAKYLFEAKDLMDFSMQGSFTLIRAMSDMLPFFNARLIGLYRLAKAGKTPEARKMILAKGLSIAMFSLALLALNSDNDDYEALEPWDADAYWHFFFGDQHYRIPKPFELGLIFGTIPERSARALLGKDTLSEYAERMGHGASDTLAFNPIPQLFKPFIELYANKDMFTGRAIEGMADEGKLPSARYNEYTSETMRTLSAALPEALGASPKRLEHLMHGYLGALGMYALGASDMMVRRLSGMPELPASRMDSLPVLKAFYQEKPTLHTKYGAEFYDMLNEVNQIHKTINAYKKEGNLDKANELSLENADKLKTRRQLETSRKQLSKLKAQVDVVYRSNLSAESKRSKIDVLMQRSNEVTRIAVQRSHPYFN